MKCRCRRHATLRPVCTLCRIIIIIFFLIALGSKGSRWLKTKKNVKNCPEMARGPGRPQRANQSCREVNTALITLQCDRNALEQELFLPHRSLTKFGNPNLSEIQLLCDLLDHASPNQSDWLK